MDDLARFRRQDPECTPCGIRHAGNLSARARYGRPDHIRLLCRGARKCRLSEREGTASLHGHLPQEGALAVLQHLDEGRGIRSTGRPVGGDPNTVGRLARMVGQHSRDAHDGLVAFPPSDRRGPVRREVALRRQGAEGPRPQRPGR